jgi:1,5-anhydro-D-fructose reductase (1,5-anhydro-D-mannitol-forming)
VFLFGPFVSVMGGATNHARAALVEDTVVGTIAFETGVLANISFCFAAGSFEDRLEIVGDSGQLSCSVFGQEPLELCNEEGTELLPVDHPYHVQWPLIASIVDELSGKPVRCPSRGDSALMASVAIDQLLHGYYGGRDDAFWARPDTWPGLRRSPV